LKYTVSNKQIIIPAQINYLPKLRKFIACLATKYKFSKSEINALTISVDEACTNIIKHGYRNSPSGSIIMKVHIKRDRLVVELIDQGISFNPNEVSDPNISHYVQSGKKGGLGIFIMRKFLDEIQYLSVGQRNILRLTKRRKNGSNYPLFIPITSALRQIMQRLFPLKK